MGDIKIFIATHKKYDVPNLDYYIPVHVGASGKESIGYVKDDTGDNISQKNPFYCELTGQYWGIKNTNSDYFGLVHYRRYFCGNEKVIINGKKIGILSSKEIYDYLEKNDILLPKKRHYYIETNKSQYLHAHHKEGLVECEKSLNKLFPEYMPSWKKMLNKRSGHRFNMFVSKTELASKYSDWLFTILGDVESKLDISSWSKNEQRVYGFLAERLLDVYVDHNNLKVKNIKYKFLEKQNWIKKGYNFLKRKFNLS
ncbi:DUF4422 domain-containing protein [Pseudobutyrivibrio sp.]|uniref:DUF4422 domain-containing protein n=1 Tax=Pseudobutyrivibrio sp. TaxID=2014367 RepID=UPI001B41AAB1|nr:DUF4422 domain-containing protein [Pseudobutyrivibrio sp.]MBP3263705.1 DUF4422 domain-containing protein [Pseudobutyrivibrio sp.]